MNVSGHGMTEQALAAMQACIKHARALLESARAVHDKGHPNIAFHLAGLALEELGRRELIGIQHIAARHDQASSIDKKMQDHVQKLFWCFFGAGFLHEKLTKERFDSIRDFSQTIHAKRLAGLYVGHEEDNLSIPADAISKKESETLIGLAESRLAIAEATKLRDVIPQEELEMQTWFLSVTDDREKRRQIFSSKSMAKLEELRDPQKWIKWLKGEFDQAELEARLAAEAELNRTLPANGSKEKWKVRVRIFSDSHAIRGKVLNVWNSRVNWIKLIPVQGKKNQLLVEFILPDNVPLDALWFYCWGLARQFVVALNIGTMGFWWWRMPEQVNKYYESIEDVERKMMISLERSPSLKIDWGENRVLTDEDLLRVVSCFVALPGPNERDKHEAFNHYIGGLTFLSLNDVHWQCEGNAFGNFFLSIQAMMAETGEWTPGTPFVPVLMKFIDEAAPNMDERARFNEIFQAFEAEKLEGLNITLKEVSFIKLFCEAYFMDRIRPTVLDAKAASRNSEAT